MTITTRRDEALTSLRELDLPRADALDPLVELLGRAVSLLEADTAVVLLLDVSGTELVATAAHGIELEVRQGVRVPLGHGFAGRIAAERRPLILDRIDESTVWNPILWQSGIRHMVGVPIEADGKLVGVVHVGSLDDHRFDERDAEILDLIAQRMGTVLHIRRLEADRRAAEVVQRSLLPSAPSRLGEFECAARYVPAELGGIGGDWYDVFTVDDSVWIVVGDVTGHGLRAATVMGRVRSALRAYALISTGPDEVVAMTDRKMHHFEVDAMATAMVAVVHPPFDHVSIALAGHPPPILATPDGAARLLDTTPGPPLGMGHRHRAAADVQPLPIGSVLVGYSDGLVERRGELISVGLERVRAAVTPGAPSRVCAEVMASAVGDHVPEDDIALLVLRRTPT